MKNITSKFIILWLLLAALVGCSAKSLTAEDGMAATPTVATETAFCATETTYSPGVAVSGTAKFRRRGSNLQINSGVVTSATTGAVIATALPIKYAEIRVLNSAGTTVQCGTTNSVGELRALNGTSPLFLPVAAGNFTIEVYARANFTFASTGKPSSATLSTAVKEDIYSNTVYKISGTFVSSGFGGGANPPLNLIAEANESVSSKIEGGAFNIYNDWVVAFEYLTNTANTGNLDVSCLNPRLDMFWKAGFNPGAYINPSGNPNSTISFYLRDHNELYICGGVLGDVSTKDTDHWDDTVILHEMGHHIENVCGRMDSPGGAHSAQYRIDPRLAFSEAWGNFIGGHILKNNTAKINPNLVPALPNGEWLHYADTVGYYEGGPITFNGNPILIRLNSPGSSANYDPVDPVSSPGESHTREASIARGLFKGVNTCANCGGGISFDKYWTALGTSINGMGYSLTPFSSSAKFFAKVFTANGNTFSASMTTITTDDEALHRVGTAAYYLTATSTSSGSITTNAWPGYGIKLTTNSSCNPISMQPKNADNTFGLESDQRFTNHFYSFSKAELAGVSQIRMVPDSACSVDLDLVVFNQSYNYVEDCGSSTPCSKAALDGVNSVTHSRNGSGSIEAVSISGLNNSYYLLNVRGFATNPNFIPGNSTCVYRLTNQSGVQLCPSTSY